MDDLNAAEAPAANQYQPQSQPGPASMINHGQYETPAPLDMSNMVYSLPSQFDPHLAYGMPYGQAYIPYSMPQHAGVAPHGHYPPFVTGQTPMYGAAYYHPSYHAPYSAGGFPMANPPWPPAAARPSSHPSSSSSSSPSKKDANRRTAKAEYDVSKTIVDGSNPSRLAPISPSTRDAERTPLSQSTSNVPRGPPRKPKQSGHALWVGNLPPGASVVELKDHFSQDATYDIESVFLISKSNCAFVNYNSAASCAAALARFHDSRFQGVRLVCRLRKGVSVPGSGTRAESEAPAAAPSNDDEETSVISEPSPAPAQEGSPLDRFFVVKSLTVEDLELSKQSGIWATQTHNETNLNHAFEVRPDRFFHVYLIFSANKSGEYFGYARMLSPISDDEALAQEMPLRPEPVTGAVDELDVTTTAATSTALQGRIIDDPARGTIFWEVESLEGDDDARSERSADGPCEEGEAEGQSFGKPFRIHWLSTDRVPFHRTRGLRNPWNANREVKIARDGTEIEPTVGRKLIQLFHLT
ncbi:hypothetical protein N7512_010253 [Penicillium capsulatum]|nr:hypothetical protein N7512_010253 [Penicillium capsulatum]